MYKDELIYLRILKCRVIENFMIFVIIVFCQVKFLQDQQRIINVTAIANIGNIGNISILNTNSPLIPIIPSPLRIKIRYCDIYRYWRVECY